MSSRIQLGPAQLDRIEDALEDLESMPLDELDLDDVVGRELVEYRELLQLGREAMPLQEVPAGLLDGVLEEARRAAAQGTPAPRASWWSRLRMGVWVPTLAFAGSAAALLVLLWPAAEPDAGKDDTVARAEPALAEPLATPVEGGVRLADAEASKAEQAADPFDRMQAQRGDGMVIGSRDAPSIAEESPAEAEAADDEEAEPLPPAKPTRSARAKGTASSKSSGSAVGGIPGAPAPPPPEPEPKAKPKTDKKAEDAGSELMGEVIEGDRARAAGNCGLAKMRYDKARTSEDRHVRARALAGKGLCEAAAGNANKAKKLFEQARAADAGVDSFIQAGLAGLDGAPASDVPNAAEQRVDVRE